MGTPGVAFCLPSWDSAANQEEQVAQRYLELLLKNPRKGTAFDRFFEYHQERGTAGDIAAILRSEAAQQSLGADAQHARWTLVGLLESKLGSNADAIESYLKAVKLSPSHSLPSFYLGQCYLLVGESSLAVEAFEQAIKAKPSRADMLEIYEHLGRTHQRELNPEQALSVWKRMEYEFPEDVRVLERIATTCTEENEHKLAISYYQRLVPLTTDVYKKTLFRVEAAEYAIQAERPDDSIVLLQRAAGIAINQDQMNLIIHRKMDLFQSQGTLEEQVNALNSRLQKSLIDGDAVDSNAWYELAIYRSGLRHWKDALQAIDTLLT